MKIISGQEIAQEIKERIRQTNETAGISPCLAMIVVGDKKEDFLYVGLKEKAVKATGGHSRIIVLPEEISREELIGEIHKLNDDEKIDGILLQLPLPEKLETERDKILAAILPEKDVDGFTPANRGRLSGEDPGYISCAALACMDVIERFIPSLQGKKALLVGDSFDLIMPLALIMIKLGCKVTIVPDYESQMLEGMDILVIEKGSVKIVQGNHIKSEILIIDTGFYWHFDQVCGNVDRDMPENIEGCLLPVPGGMGPILIAKLMENLSQAARCRQV